MGAGEGAHRAWDRAQRQVVERLLELALSIIKDTNSAPSEGVVMFAWRRQSDSGRTREIARLRASCIAPDACIDW